jgi:rhamnogalacturonan endolyase
MRTRTRNMTQFLVRGCVALLLGGAVTLLQGCDSSGAGSASTAGAPGSAGVTGGGGNVTSGSPAATGGNPTASGGGPASTGGSIPVGGSTTAGGGATTSTPVVTGGTPSSGGIPTSGGAPGGAPSSGGIPTSGGAPGRGGTPSSGGIPTSGGARGGTPSSGGASSPGGATAPTSVPPTGGTLPPNPGAVRYMEKLDRGLVAVKSGSGYFLSWRLFGTDPQDTSFGFNVYRGTTKLNTTLITDSTNYLDSAGGSGTYTVKPVTGGVEGAASENALVIDNGYINIPLKPPAAGSSHGSSYTETANDASTGDLDGDGQYEIVLKWDPSNSHDNEQTGYTGPTYLDGYKLDGTQMWRINLGPNIRSGAHYTQFLVYDFDGDGMAEVACKTAPGTTDGTGGFLKTGPAAGADNTIDYTSTDATTQGKVITGPEWYTVFAGKTGAELATITYLPGRGAVGVWGAIQGIASPAGDLGWGDDSVYNFVDRFLASVAYLDGERPSLIPCRGYYWRTSLWALDWRNGQLTQRWLFDTAAVPGAKGKDGKPLQSSQGYESQGSHSVRQGDVDGDGFDEIVYGSMTVDHDGQGLYSTGLRHGDALHLSDLDPTRPGLEVWMVDEQTSENGGISSHFQDAKDGTIIWEQKGTGDNGRGCTGPLIAGTTGWQMWSGAGGLFDASQKTVGAIPSSDNFTIWWGADLNRFLENGTSISPYGSGGGTGLSASGCTSNNGSKSDPALTADLFGDWREEVVYRTTGNDALRIYTTTTVTTKRLYTLMHDPIYRMSVATENVAYNQPPEPGIYIGPNMTLPQTKPNIKYYDLPAH